MEGVWHEEIRMFKVKLVKSNENIATLRTENVDLRLYNMDGMIFCRLDDYTKEEDTA
jgi:hypothetical protein